MFADLRQHGNTKWTYDVLLRTSLCWMISERRTWRRRFDNVAGLWMDETDHRRRTFEGFLKAVRRNYQLLTERMIGQLRKVMMDISPELRQIAGRDVFAVDGTSMELPRTFANQKFFCGDDVDIANADGTECTWKLAPQMHLTALWHVKLALPWKWSAAAGDTSERNDLRDMVSSLPENALVVGDAGFVGYDLWSTILNAGVDIVIRVGSNVHLIEGLELTPGRDDLVSFWPNEARRAGHPPQTLRLVNTKLGNTDAYLVTNVLDPKELSDAEVVEIYKARWGVEVFYRGLKQTFAKRRLMGRTPDSALAELNLSMLALWMLHLLGLEHSKEIKAKKPSLARLSTVKLLDAFRDAMSSPAEIPSEARSLSVLLRTAHLDDYHRKKSKQSRRYPRQNKQIKCGAPEIRPPKHEEKTKLKSLIRLGKYNPIAN